MPAPPHLLGRCLGALERYMHAEDSLHPLVRIGLIHAQFETITPSVDGNGRMGRLLISLLLEQWKFLSRPVLYLSVFFKRHHAEYCSRLNGVRASGDWDAWLDFFLDGVGTTAEEAVTSARDLFSLISADRARLLDRSDVSVASMRLFEALPSHPVLTTASVMRVLGATRPAAGRAIDTLVKAGLLVETTGRKRDRSFMYEGYVSRLRVGTELDGT